MTTDDFQWREYYANQPTDDLQREYTWHSNHILDVSNKPTTDEIDHADLDDSQMHLDIIVEILHERNALSQKSEASDSLPTLARLLGYRTLNELRMHDHLNDPPVVRDIPDYTPNVRHALIAALVDALLAAEGVEL